jgi:uncharacterized protein YegP (UPF0339 family)
MAAKFEIRSPKAGRYQWVLTSQGRTLATGEAYARRALAEKSIASFRMAATAAPVIDTTVPAASPAVAKAARTSGRAVGQAAATTRRTVKVAARKAPTAAKRTVNKAAKAVEKTATKAANKTAAPRKRTTRSR